MNEWMVKWDQLRNLFWVGCFLWNTTSSLSIIWKKILSTIWLFHSCSKTWLTQLTTSYPRTTAWSLATLICSKLYNQNNSFPNRNADIPFSRTYYFYFLPWVEKISFFKLYLLHELLKLGGPTEYQVNHAPFTNDKSQLRGRVTCPRLHSI